MSFEYALLNWHSGDQQKIAPLRLPANKTFEKRRTADHTRRMQKIRRYCEEVLHPILVDTLEKWWLPYTKFQFECQGILVHPNGEREPFTFYNSDIRIGRSPTCHIVLASPTVSGMHCQIQFRGERIYCMDMGSTNGTYIGDEKLTPHTPHEIHIDTDIFIHPYRIRITSVNQNFQKKFRCAVSWKSNAYIRSWDVLGKRFSREDLWVLAFRNGAPIALVLPYSFVRFFTWIMGLPDSGEIALPDPVDREITAFLVHQISTELSKRLEVSLNVSSLCTFEEVQEIVTGEGGFDVVEYELICEEKKVPVWVVLPVHAEDSGERILPEFPVVIQVIGGWFRLGMTELMHVDPGDILLPDVWFYALADPGNETHVVLQAGNVFQKSVLQVQEGECKLTLSKRWEYLPQGGILVSDESHEHQVEGNGVHFPDDAEFQIVIELGRIRVPLRDLMEWDEEKVLVLHRRVEDPVDILINQAGEYRKIGEGKLVDYEGQVGVQIIRWLVKKHE